MANKQPSYYDTHFAPDEDVWWNVNPGMLLDVTDLVPSKKGSLKSYLCASAQAIACGTFSEATYGTTLTGKIIKRIDGTARMFAGTTKRILENTSAAWVDVSLGGADYTTAADWDFATFGNDVLAVSKANNTQISSTVAGVFAALGGGSPKASCITVQKNFVILGDTDDGTNNLGDNLMWSALANDKSWTASASTQAGNLRILDTPGNITALVNMRDAVAVYKEDSLHILDYQGSPLLWTSRLISDKVGCASKHGVAVVNGIHYFLHRTGLHRFDGASVINIGRPIYRYLFDKVGSQVNYATVHAIHDEYEGLILFYFHDPNAASGEKRYALGYHPETGRFGFVKNAWGTDTCRAAMKATLSDVTAWNSSQATQTTNALLLGNISGTGVTLRRPLFGSSNASSAALQTGVIGDEINYTTLSAIKVRCNSIGTISDATVYSSDNGNVPLTGGTTFTGNQSRQRFEGLKSNRFFVISVPLSTVGEVNGIYLTTTQSGLE